MQLDSLRGEGHDDKNHWKPTLFDHYPLQKRTASMWLNEINPVLWQMLPQEFHQAAASFLNADKTFLAGTPVRLYMTMEPPALQRALEGDFRVEVALTRRSTNPLPDSIWTAPKTGYAKMPLGDQAEQMQKMMRDVLSSGADALPGMGLRANALRKSKRSVEYFAE